MSIREEQCNKVCRILDDDWKNDILEGSRTDAAAGTIQGRRTEMTKEEALKAWEKMYSEIDKENYLFVGTINPQMVEWAIKALKEALKA